MSEKTCPDCGVDPEQLHIPGCDVERCPACGGQSLSCDCIYEFFGMDLDTLEEEYPDIYARGPTGAMLAAWDAKWGRRRMPWTGEWPGDAECREYGFWCFWDGGRPKGEGWVSCDPGKEGAVPDLNRLAATCDWDAETRRWVKRSKGR